MRCDRKTMRLYAVTDRTWADGAKFLAQVEGVLKNGVTCLQLREKNLSDEEFLREAVEVGALCRKYGVPFIVNDNVEVAVRSGADGVHVGQGDMAPSRVRVVAGSDMIIGVSAHTVEEATEAVKNGADYLGLGAVFRTSTKTDADVMPRETLRAICGATPVPTVAIGGITAQNVASLKGSGVDGVAAVSAVFGAKDPALAAAELRALVDEVLSDDE